MSIRCYEFPEVISSRWRIRAMTAAWQRAQRGLYTAICGEHAFSHGLGRLLPAASIKITLDDSRRGQ